MQAESETDKTQKKAESLRTSPETMHYGCRETVLYKFTIDLLLMKCDIDFMHTFANLRQICKKLQYCRPRQNIFHQNCSIVEKQQHKSESHRHILSATRIHRKFSRTPVDGIDYKLSEGGKLKLTGSYRGTAAMTP